MLSNIDTINNFYDLSFPFRVEVPLEHLANPIQDIKEENDIDVPLPTDQVRYIFKLKHSCANIVKDSINRTNNNVRHSDCQISK